MKRFLVATALTLTAVALTVTHPSGQDGSVGSQSKGGGSASGRPTAPNLGAPDGWPDRHTVPVVPGGGTTPAQGAKGDKLDIRISSVYDVGSFGLTRTGVDTASGTMILEQGGIYRGTASLAVFGTAHVPGKTCAANGFGWQVANVVGVPLVRDEVPGQQAPAFYTSVHRPADYVWKRGTAVKYLRLEFIPKTPPAYDPKDDCQDEIPGPHAQSTPNFIPLNDAQWTIEGFGSVGGQDTVNRAGYAIALPETGLLRYEDHTSDSTKNSGLTIGSINLGRLVKADTTWYVSVTRTKSN